jgi:outer membrane protein
MKKVTVVLTLALILVARGALAADNVAEKKVLTLAQAQDAAMQNSLTIKDANYDLEAAQKKIWETTATGLPQADAKYNFTYNPGSITTLPMGPNGEEVPIMQRTTSNLTATVSQLIFSGSYIVGLKASKTYREIVQQSLEKTQIDVRSAVAQSYYLILLTNQTAEVLKRNLENLNKLLDDSQKMLDKGFAEETDVDQLRLSVNDLKLSLESILNQEKVARRLLNFQIGIELETSIELSDKLEDIVRGINREKVIQTPFVLDSNIDYRMALTNIKSTKLQYNLEQVSYLPTVAGFYQYYKDFKSTVFSFNPQQMLGLSVTIPIFSSGQRYSKVQQARLKMSKAENAREQAARALTMEYQQAREDFNTAWEKYLNSKSSQGLAQKVFRDVTIKYNNGMASSMDLTQANDKLLQTVSNLYSVEFDLLKAKIRLDKVTSNL